MAKLEFRVLGHLDGEKTKSIMFLTYQTSGLDPGPELSSLNSLITPQNTFILFMPLARVQWPNWGIRSTRVQGYLAGEGQRVS